MTANDIADAAEQLTGDRPAIYRPDGPAAVPAPKFPRLLRLSPVLSRGELQLLIRLSTGPVNYAALVSTEGLYPLLREGLAEIDRVTDEITITEFGKQHLFAGP